MRAEAAGGRRLSDGRLSRRYIPFGRLPPDGFHMQKGYPASRIPSFYARFRAYSTAQISAVIGIERITPTLLESPLMTSTAK